MESASKIALHNDADCILRIPGLPDLGDPHQLWNKANATLHLNETWVRAQVIEVWSDAEREQMIGMFFVGLAQQFDCAVFLSQSDINARTVGWRNMPPFGLLF